MPFKDKEKAQEYKNNWRREQRRKRGLQKPGRKPHTELEKLEAKQQRRNWEKAWRKKYHEENPVNRLLWRAKARAKQYNIPFNITKEDIILPTHCPYLGIPLIYSRPRGITGDNVISIDRIDNTKGYVRGNIEIISLLANTMKSNASKENLISFANEILKRYG